jgi:hypothetical protein
LAAEAHTVFGIDGQLVPAHISDRRKTVAQTLSRFWREDEGQDGSPGGGGNDRRFIPFEGGISTALSEGVSAL